MSATSSKTSRRRSPRTGASALVPTAYYAYDDLGNPDCVSTDEARPTCSISNDKTPASSVLADYTYDSPTSRGYRAYAGGTKTDSATYTYDALTGHQGARVPPRLWGQDDQVVLPRAHRRPRARRPSRPQARSPRPTPTTPRACASSDPQPRLHRPPALHLRLRRPRLGVPAARQRRPDQRAIRIRPYGEEDTTLTKGDPTNDVNITNPFRYRPRPATPLRDDRHGAWRFSPDTSRFLQADLYRGALSDLSLATDPDPEPLCPSGRQPGQLRGGRMATPFTSTATAPRQNQRQERQQHQTDQRVVAGNAWMGQEEVGVTANPEWIVEDMPGTTHADVQVRRNPNYYYGLHPDASCAQVGSRQRLRRRAPRHPGAGPPALEVSPRIRCIADSSDRASHCAGCHSWQVGKIPDVARGPGLATRLGKGIARRRSRQGLKGASRAQRTPVVWLVSFHPMRQLRSSREVAVSRTRHRRHHGRSSRSKPGQPVRDQGPDRRRQQHYSVGLAYITDLPKPLRSVPGALLLQRGHGRGELRGLQGRVRGGGSDESHLRKAVRCPGR